MQEDRFYIVYDWQVQAVKQTKPLQVFALLYGLCTANGGTCEASNAYIMQRTGMQEYDVRRCLKYLTEGGFIHRTQGNGRGGVSTYTVCEKGLQNLYPLQEKGNKINTLSDEKRVTNLQEKGNKFAPQIINNNKNNSSSSTPAHTQEGKEIAFAWLTDNEERMAALCMQNHIPKNGTLIDTLRPFIEDFLQGEIGAGTDFYLEDPQDVKRHFSNWLRQNHQRVTIKTIQDNDDRTNPTTSEDDTAGTIQEPVITGYDPRVGEALRNIMLGV